MMARSHVPFAIISWIGWCAITPQHPSILTCAIAGVAGLLPDIDHPNSVLGKRVPMISYPIAKVFGHRGITHSLFATCLIAYAIYALSVSQNIPLLKDIILLPLMIGYLSHLLGDLLTPAGVPLFWPYRKNFSIGLFKTDSWLETAFVYSLIFFTLMTSSYGTEIISILQHSPQHTLHTVLSFLDPRL